MNSLSARRMRALAGALMMAAYALMPLYHLFALQHASSSSPCETCPDGVSLNTQNTAEHSHHNQTACGMCQIALGAPGVAVSNPPIFVAAPIQTEHAAPPTFANIATGPDVHVIGPRGPPC